MGWLPKRERGRAHHAGQNVCRNESAGLVGMEINESKKYLKTLERVKRSDSNFSFDFR
jgi:hypothetical protein